jgi:AraC-like DNA-binding protein
MTTDSFSWDASIIPAPRRFEAFVEGVCRAFAQLDPVLLDRGAAFHARIEHREADGVGVTHLAGSNYISRRTPAGIARSQSDDFFLNYVVSGTIHARQGDDRREVADGDIFVLDNARPFELAMRSGGAFRSTVVRMGRPRWLAADDGSLLSIDAAFRGHPLLPLLKMNLATLSRGGAMAHAGQVAFFGQTTTRLVELMLCDRPGQAFAQDTGGWHGLVCLEIDRNLWDADFSLEQLAAHLKLSPRRVQRILADRELTFSAYLRERRLSAAAAKLKDRTESRSIEAIAAESGFRDISTFYRSFRRQYGINPGDLRRA